MAYKSKRVPYNPQSPEAYRLSRSKIELFFNCRRCFYLELRLGIARPPSLPFNLNNAVDGLLKKEFDYHRSRGDTHPLLAKRQIDAYPASHPRLDDWRNTFVGVEFLHRPTNFLVFGGIDDLGRNAAGEYIVVDYKATSSKYPVKSLDKPGHASYKRQLEIYQGLLRENNLPVSATGYFFYCNGNREQDGLHGKMHFDIEIIPHRGTTDGVESTLLAIHECLQKPEIPAPNSDCNYCNYVKQIQHLWFTPDAE